MQHISILGRSITSFHLRKLCIFDISTIFHLEAVFWVNQTVIEHYFFILESYATSDTISPCINALALCLVVNPFSLKAISIIQQKSPITLKLTLFKITNIELSAVVIVLSEGKPSLALEVAIDEKAFITLTVYSD